MRGAVARSGYLFEQSLVPAIEHAGFKATANHRFTNPWTGDVEELDVHAIGGNPIVEGEMHFVFPILLAECKNLAAPIVVFTQRELRMGLFLGMPHFSGLPLQVHAGRRLRNLAAFLDCDAWHHYYRGARAGSQFCAVAPRKESISKPLAKLVSEDYVAGHKVGEADLFQAVRKLVAAVYAECIAHARSWRFGRARELINLQAYYPTLITAGPLYECYVGSARPQYRRVHRAGFVFRRVEGDHVVDERLDIVDGLGLPPLLAAIERDQERMILRMRGRLPTLRRAVDRTVSKLRSASQKQRVAILSGTAGEL